MTSSDKSRIEGNPVKYDPGLKALIGELDSIRSIRAFRQWKANFLTAFQEFLSDEGVEPANEAYMQFAHNMATFEKTVSQVQKLLRKGDISSERTTVRGRHALNEMNNSIASIIREQKELIPARASDEKKKKYNKYHLGAILVHYGFEEYYRMTRCAEIMEEIKVNGLDELGNKQQLVEIANYSQQIKQFQEIMSDLGLFDVMMKSEDFTGGEMDEIVFFNPQTKSIIEMPREKVIKMGILTVTEDENGKSTIREDEKSEVQKQDLLERIKVFYD